MVNRRVTTMRKEKNIFSIACKGAFCLLPFGEGETPLVGYPLSPCLPLSVPFYELLSALWGGADAPLVGCPDAFVCLCQGTCRH